MEKSGLRRTAIFLLPFIVVLIIYGLTAYPTVPFWHGCSYALTSLELGVNPPPGSLLLSILGWLVTLLPLGISKIFALHLLAGLIATATAYITFRLLATLHTVSSPSKPAAPTIYICMFASVLYMTFTKTMWYHAVQFTPYILTMLFTVLILFAFIKFWLASSKDSELRWLFILIFLIGLDLSVHRTNFLLIPAIAVSILLKSPRIFIKIKYWLTGIAGAVAGLSFHLLLLPIAATKPIVNINNPDNFSRFYDYISLKQYGGNWLVTVYPRKAEFFAIQMRDYLEVLNDNLFVFSGTAVFINDIILFIMVLGFWYLWSISKKLPIAVFLFLISVSFGAVFYFNNPENYYFPMDRHFLPSIVLLVILLACGIMFLINKSVTLKKDPKRVSLGAILIFMVSLPLYQLIHNYERVDSSERFFAEDYAMNILNSVDDNAIIVVMGDNYWPILYFNHFQQVRPDVTVLSQSLLNTEWYIGQLIERYPDLPYPDSLELITETTVHPWTDSTITIPSAIDDDTAYINVTPSLADKYLLHQDWVVLHLLMTSRWEQPIYFTNPPQWLIPYLRFDGVVYRVMPEESPVSDIELLHDNILNKYAYRGFSDSTITMDIFTEGVAKSYQNMFLRYAMTQLQTGQTEQLQKTINLFEQTLPQGRVEASEQYIQTIDRIKQYLETPPDTTNR